MRDWVTNVDTTHYLFGTVAGPHPFPTMVRDFQRVIGDEAPRAGARADRRGCPTRSRPASAAAPTRSASSPRSSTTPASRLVGFEAGGDGVDTGRHAATITGGTPGVLHGARTYLLQDEDGQTIESHSISAGLDYPGVGPSTPTCTTPAGPSTGRSPTPRRWTRFALLCRTEGIIPAIESAHALAGALQLGPRARPGRGRSW